MDRMFCAIGAASAGVAVALGAFGAHALRDRLGPQMLAIYETGVRYQMYHALGLLVVGLAIGRFAGAGDATFLTTSGWLFVAGTVLFSGSLYILTLTGARWLGAVTPLGGVAFILGWACLLIGALKR